MSGRSEQNHWRWRRWERELEEHASDQELAAIADAYDPVEHNADYVWVSSPFGGEVGPRSEPASLTPP